MERQEIAFRHLSVIFTDKDIRLFSDCREKELKELQKKQQEHSDNILILHTASFYGPNTRNDRQERMRRSRSMPKINQEEEVLVIFTLY